LAQSHDRREHRCRAESRGPGHPTLRQGECPRRGRNPGKPRQSLDDKQKPWFEDTPPRPLPPDPTIISHQDETFEVPADRVETFIERVIAHFGGKKEGGHTNITLDSSPEFKDGHCTGAGVKVTTTITRLRLGPYGAAAARRATSTRRPSRRRCN
jgi:hypothetical protein